jgi:hypothetical protein
MHVNIEIQIVVPRPSASASLTGRRQKPEPKRAIILNVGQDNFISCSLFFRSGFGQKTFVCLPSDADFHARVNSASIASFSSLLIVLFATRPWLITEVEHPPALASVSAASLPMIGLNPFQANLVQSAKFIEAVSGFFIGLFGDICRVQGFKCCLVVHMKDNPFALYFVV